MLRISDAASLALHAMAVLASVDDSSKMSVTSLSKRLAVSDHHLAKVMQRLNKQGLVSSRRGPKGGFVLARPAGEITLLEIFEAIEGPLPNKTCLMNTMVCNGTCILGDLLHSVNRLVRQHLEKNSLADMASGFVSEKKTFLP